MIRSIHELLCLFVLASIHFARAQGPISIDRQITIQPILISNGTLTNNPSHLLFEEETDKIWSQARIDVKFLPPIVYTNAQFFNVTAGSGSTSLNSLSTTIGNGASENPSVINMWLVNLIGGNSANLGLALQSSPGNGFTVVRNGIAIAASAFSLNARNVLAHEIGHSLGLDHSTFGASGQQNLMSQSSVPGGGISVSDIYPDGGDFCQMNAAQVTQARSVTQFVVPITPFTYSSGSQAPRLSISQAEGLPKIELSGEIGKVYRFEFASPLSGLEGQWTILSIPDLVLTNSSQSVVDASFSGSARFYRAKVVAP